MTVAASKPVAVATPVAAPAAAPAAPFAAGVPGIDPKAPKLGDPDVPDAPAVPALGDPDAPDAPDAPPADPDAPPDDKPIEYTFQVPEGREPYRAPVLDAYKAVLGKHKVAPEIAQDILQSVLPTIEKDLVAQHEERLAAAETAGRAELEQRHDARLPEVMRLANKFLAKAASPALAKAIAESPLLRANPDFIDMLAAGGQRFTNDRAPSSNGPQSIEETGTAEQRAARAYDRAAAIQPTGV